MAKPGQVDAPLSRGGMSSPPRGCARVPMAAPPSAGEQRCGLRLQRPAEGTLLVHLSGSWRLRDRLPDAAEIQREIDAGPPVRRLTFETGEVTAWDSGLLAFLWEVIVPSRRKGIEPDLALVKYKKLVGGGTIKIVNQTVPHALRDVGVLVEPLSVGLHAVRSSEIQKGASIAILGAGPIGLSVLLCAKAIVPSCTVYMTDRITERLEAATECGANWTGYADPEELATAKR